MTRTQFSNISGKVMSTIEKQGCAAIKATMSSSDFDRFRDKTDLRAYVDYYYSLPIGNTVFVFALVLNTEEYDRYEYAGYIISELYYYGAKKIECM